MSWGEVKKINSDLSVSLDKKLDSLSTKINSNLNIPLNNKMEYVDGLFKRGANVRYITNRATNRNNLVLVDVTGSGILTVCKLEGRCYSSGSGTPTYNYSDKIYVDGVLVQTFTANLRYNDYVNRGFEFKKDSSYGFKIGNIPSDSIRETNIPIIFNKSLKIVSTLNGNAVEQAITTINYGLY